MPRSIYESALHGALSREALLGPAFEKLTGEIEMIPVGGLGRLLEIGTDLKRCHEMQGNAAAAEKVQKGIEEIEQKIATAEGA